MCPCAAWRTFCNLPACPNVTVCNMLRCVLVGLTIGARGDPNIKLPPQCHSQPTFLSDPNSHIVPRTIGAQLPFGQTQCPFERVFAFADKSARARPHHMELSPSNNTLTDPSGIAYTIAYELFWLGPKIEHRGDTNARTQRHAHRYRSTRCTWPPTKCRMFDGKRVEQTEKNDIFDNAKSHSFVAVHGKLWESTEKNERAKLLVNGIVNTEKW